jgi:hypothetical protein
MGHRAALAKRLGALMPTRSFVTLRLRACLTDAHTARVWRPNEHPAVMTT